MRVTVIMEDQTAGLSTDRRVQENVREAMRQAAALPAPGGEVVMMSSEPFTNAPEGLRCVVVPGKCYYELKNRGLGEALGEFVVFTDADCRLGEGYLERVIAAFAERPDISCLAGRSFYDGKGFLARLNTALSFGYLHNPQTKSTEPYGVVAHNVAIRRADAPPQPFGNFAGRVAGDSWLTQWYRERGRGPLLDGGLVVYHEDPSYSVKLRLDRQLREVLCTLRNPGDLLPWRLGAWRALGKAMISPVWRGRKLVRFGRHVGMNPLTMLLGLPVLLAYGVLDVVAVLTMMAVPRLGERWLEYQNG